MTPSDPIRIVFLGTPMFSVPCLKDLMAADGIALLAVITQPDKPAGRGQKLTPPPVKTLADEAGVTVFQPQSLKKDTELLDWLRRERPDFLVTIAFGQILSQAVLDIPRYGTVNVHASLLPEYRGANPIQQAVLDGKTETGLTTMLTDIGVDTGDMLLKQTTPIGPDETTGELTIRLSALAGPLLIDTLRGVKGGTVIPQPQDHEKSTHAPKCRKEDARLDWALPAPTLHNRIRGFNPWPMAFGEINGERIKIVQSRLPETETTPQAEPGTIIGVLKDRIRIATGQGAIDVLTLQPPGKKPMNAADWARGALKDNQQKDRQQVCRFS